MSQYLAQQKETLRQICAALSREYKLPIELDDNQAGARTHTKHKKILLGTKNLAEYGLEYHVGLVVHEIAHVRYSPDIPSSWDKKDIPLLNLIEDKRIEAIMESEYSGGEYYLGALHAPSIESITSVLTKPDGRISKHTSVSEMVKSPFYRSKVNREDYIDTQTRSWKEPGGMEAYRAAQGAEDMTQQNESRKRLFMRCIGLAVLMFEGCAGLGATTGNDELDTMASEVAKRLRLSRRAADFAAGEALARECVRILRHIIPLPDQEGTQAQTSQHIDFGGHGDTEDTRLPSADGEYTRQDEYAKPDVAKLKKKLIARMRENDHQKYIGHKRRGLIDKKSLSRVARHNYRIYRKRQEKKGKDYSVALLVDTSGSMFNHGNRISTALYSASLLARTFRGMGFPTSLTIYGKIAHTVLYARERYIPQDIETKMTQSTGNDHAYQSGYNNTDRGIAQCVKLLNKNSAGRQKLLVIITDGGLDSADVKKSRELLAIAKRKGIHTMIFYLEAYTSRLLDRDEKRERQILRADELIPACIELAESVAT